MLRVAWDLRPVPPTDWVCITQDYLQELYAEIAELRALRVKVQEALAA